MKEKVNQLFKDKLTLVMLVLGLLTIVAAAGVVTLQRGQTEESPYLNLEGDPEHLVDGAGEGQMQAEGASDAGQGTGALADGSAAGDAGEGLDGSTAGTGSQKQSADAAAAEGQDGSGSEQLAADHGAAADSADGLSEEAALAGAGLDAATGLVLNFAQTQSMLWPVEGNVLLDYNMDSTIYFPTLEQYKCNPGLVIQGDVSQPVTAPANARVMESGTNEEIGNYLVLDLGDDYALTCGQLKEVQAVEGEYLEKGQILGYVAEPTKYYTLEGPNVFLELTKNGKTVDPLDYLE
ncbi:MAG: peptidoglycan DD-metalloendopeptidase family protein [Lachnospiraceae bacterium]|nr:peptidoglycan DD-metalloendopeptidase family protein [Lachnospiraceae bacterium]